jgi:DNA helicase-2/ATP-dependent DNA helicase PcrA
VREKDIEAYLNAYPDCVQLQDSVKEKRTKFNHTCLNFGQSKGLGFDRVLIFPTGPIRKWILDKKTELAPTTRCKLYVAVTRARFSVGIVYDYEDSEDVEGFEKYDGKNQ